MAHKTKNGTWRVRWRENGKWRSKLFTKGTPKSVVDHFEAKLTLGDISPRKSKKCPTFFEYANRWIENYSIIHKTASSTKKDRQILRDHLIPRLGGKRLDQIERSMIRDIRTELFSGRGFAAQTVNNILGLCHKIFDTALIEDELLAVNPVAGIRRIPKKNRNFKFWTFEEKNRFLNFCRSENWNLFQIVATGAEAGLRPMEIRALKRDCLDFVAGEITVKRNWCTKTNQLVNYTKTKKDRKVPMSPALISVLSDKKMLAADQFIFSGICNGFGHRFIQPMARRAGVTEIRFHDLRHTFASHLVMRGVSFIKVMELLGHTKMESTLVYAHLAPSSLRGITDILSADSDWSAAPQLKVVPLESAQPISARITL